MKVLVVVLALLLLAPAGNAVPIVFDDFESDLSQWTGRAMGAHTGVIVADPIRPANQVLSFSALASGGDVFSIVSVDGPWFEVSFEYLGLPGLGGTPGNLGGFMGLSVGHPGRHDWLAGTDGISAPLDLIDDGQWHSVSIIYTSSIGDALHVMLEDWSGSGGVAGDVFFDNVRVVPERGTATLLGSGLLLIAFRRRPAASPL